MIAAVAPVTALLLSVALLLMGNGLQGTLLPVRAGIEAFSAIDIGVLGSAYFLGFAAGCFFGPHVVRRAGHIRAFAAVVAVASSVVLAHSLILNVIAWWCLRAATGFCFAVLFLIIESWLNEKATNENRGTVFSLYTIINLSVMTLGQLMLVLDDPGDYPLFLLASILVSLAAVPVAMTRQEGPAPVHAVRIRLIKLYRLSPIGVVGCLAVGLANGSFWSLAPVFAQKGGEDVAGVALFMSVVVIAGAIGQWPLGRASDRMDRRKVVILACAGAAFTGLALFLFGGGGTRALLLLAFAFGLFAFPIYSLCVAHMNDTVEADTYVETASGLLLTYAIGAAIGPVIASTAMRYGGSDSLFAFTAGVHVLTAAFAFYRMRKRAPRPEEEHMAFADSLVVAQTVSAMDPLAEAVERETAQPDQSIRADADGGESGSGWQGRSQGSISKP